MNATQVRSLDALRLDVRVADIVGHSSLLAADCALGWHKYLQKGGKLYHREMRSASDWIGRVRAFATWAILGPVLVAALASGCRPKTARNAPAVGGLYGVVANENGKPLASVTLEVGAQPPDGRVPLAIAKTDGVGTFRIFNLPVGTFRLTAKSRGFVPAETPIEIREHPQAEVHLVLGRAVALGGSVEDRRGAPIPFARVVVFPMAATSLPVRVSATDARGHFQAADLVTGAYRLLIEAPGLGTSAAGPVTAPDTSVRVILPGESRSIIGRVRRAEQGSASAQVFLVGEGVAEVRRMDTDAEGNFAFSGLGPGSYTVGAASGGWASTMVSLVIPEHPAESDPALSVQLSLAPGMFLRGVVRDENQAGVLAAEVWVDTIPTTGIFAPALTDGNGAWMSGALPPGKYRLQARRAGMVATRTPMLDLTAAMSGKDALGSGVPIVLEMAHTAKVVGRLIDEKGAPVSNAQLRNQLARIEALGVVTTPLPLAAEAAALPSPGFSTSGPSSGVPVLRSRPGRGFTSDSKGHFDITEIPPGRFRLQVVSPRGDLIQPQLRDLRPGQIENLGDVKIRLTSGG